MGAAFFGQQGKIFNNLTGGIYEVFKIIQKGCGSLHGCGHGVVAHPCDHGICRRRHRHD